jgi:hypothetical protein
MVVVQLAGGLGNQMFQYALGRSVARRRRNDELVFHISTPPFDTPMLKINPDILSFGLDVFNVDVTVTTLDKLRTNPGGVIWTITEAGSDYVPEVICECHHHSHIGLVGFWQSDKYFKGDAALIRQAFSFKNTYKNPHDPALLSKILQEDSVCVHVRRADYLLPDDTKGFVGLAYYQAAVALIRAKLATPRLFVFSDDIEWCRKTLRFLDPAVFVAHADTATPHAADDFYLMSQCRHFVIANSTYSWWAAWLGMERNGLVLAPKRWYRWEESADDQESYLSSRDLIPEGWVRI